MTALAPESHKVIPDQKPGSAHAPAPFDAASAQHTVGAIVSNMTSVIRGHDDAVYTAIAALVAQGHVLLDDLPGTGKTTFARAVAKTLGGQFGRIQSTADLMSSDVTGSSMWNPGQGEFIFIPGPIFANVVLVDELNRTPARTQSAFMEAMAEHTVTADGTQYALPNPFFVIATQNPVEQHGTFPLPQGQMDRFMVRLALGPVQPDVEIQIMKAQLGHATVEDLNPVIDPTSLSALQHYARSIHISDAVYTLIVDLATATRTHQGVHVGVSTRAAIDVARLSQSWALLQGRDHVIPDDVQAMAIPALAHRLELASGDTAFNTTTSMMAEICRTVPVSIAV